MQEIIDYNRQLQNYLIMSLGEYYERITRQPLLSKEEELDLFLELSDEGLPEDRRLQIRDRILQANLRFVFKQAKKCSKNDPELFAELIAAGNEGLIVGIQKYDPKSGNRFLTYAGWWVMQRMLEHMSNQRIVSLPTWKQQLAAKIQKVVEANETITFDDLKKHFPDVQEKVLWELFQTRYLTFYIEDLQDDTSFEINPIEEHIEQRMDRERLHNAVSRLPDPIRQVISMSFGLEDGEEKKPLEICRALKITRDQMRTMKVEGLQLLKEEFGDQNPFA